jgi:hypothetical protein
MGFTLLLAGKIRLDSAAAKTAFLLGMGVLSYGAACFVFKVEEVGKLWKMGRQFIMKRISLF